MPETPVEYNIIKLHYLKGDSGNPPLSSTPYYSMVLWVEFN
jgi:hypothetical protein